MLPEMNDKNADIESVAKKALADKGLLAEIMGGLKEKNEALRYNCHKVLMELTREHGEVLYPYWEYLVEMLDGNNAYRKLSAVHLIARLCKVDKEGRFDKIFDMFFSLLGDRGTILAAYVAANSGKIAVAKPHLRERITGMLIDIDRLYQGKQLEMTKAYIIEAFGEYFEAAEDKEKIKEFVRKQLDSGSPKARKEAKAFLNKWD